MRTGWQQRGQALVTLLVYMVVATTVVTLAVSLMVRNTQGTSAVEQSMYARQAADSGVELALLRILRNPTYTGTESLTVGDGSATVTVTGNETKTISSKGIMGRFVRTVEAVVTTTNEQVILVSWQEVW